jgi:hypothetical protein
MVVFLLVGCLVGLCVVALWTVIDVLFLGGDD